MRQAAIHLAVGALVLGAVAPALGQVLEIDSAGAVTVHSRPEVTSSAGAAPIAAFAPSRRHGHGRRGARVGPAVDLRAPLASAAAGAQLSPDLVEAVAWQESRLRHGLVSPRGAIGEMQLMPATALALGVDPFDRDQNLRGGAAYLQGLLHRYDGDVVRALAAYNAGPGAVERYAGVPPYRETRDYVAGVLNHMSEQALGGSPETKR